MDQQHVTRRIVLGAAVVGLAVLTALGGGDRVNAEPNTGHNHGSKAAFKSSCESNFIDGHHGEFVDSPKDGLTVCVYGDGSKNTCDQQGNNCTYTNPPKQIDSGIDVADAPLIVDDTQTVAPVDAPLEAITEAPLEAVAETSIEAPVDSQVPSAAESSTLAAPVEAPVTLTEEPVAAEEPMAAEVSAEQP